MRLDGDRSCAVVTFSSRGSPSTTFTRPPRRLDERRAVGRRVDVARERRPEPSAANACGVCAATRPSRASVSEDLLASTLLIVSATGSAGTTPPIPRQRRGTRSINPRRQERPGGVVNEHARGARAPPPSRAARTRTAPPPTTAWATFPAPSSSRAGYRLFPASGATTTIARPSPMASSRRGSRRAAAGRRDARMPSACPLEDDRRCRRRR